MKRKGCIVGMIGAMTLLLSFHGFSQEEIKLKKVQHVKVKKPLKISRNITDSGQEQKEIKREIQRKPIIRLKAEKLIRVEKRYDIREPKRVPLTD